MDLKKIEDAGVTVVGISYDSVDDLAAQLRRLLATPTIISEYRARAMARVRARYNWEQITNQYEWLLAKLAGLETTAKPLPLLSREVNVKEVESLSYPVTTFAESRVVEVSRRAAVK